MTIFENKRYNFLEHWKPNQKINNYIFWYQDMEYMYVEKKCKYYLRWANPYALNPEKRLKDSIKRISFECNWKVKNSTKHKITQWELFKHRNEPRNYEKPICYMGTPDYFLSEIGYNWFNIIKKIPIKTKKFSNLKSSEFLVKDIKKNKIYVCEVLHPNEPSSKNPNGNYDLKVITIKRIYT